MVNVRGLAESVFVWNDTSSGILSYFCAIYIIIMYNWGHKWHDGRPTTDYIYNNYAVNVYKYLSGLHKFCDAFDPILLHIFK